MSIDEKIDEFFNNITRRKTIDEYSKTIPDYYFATKNFYWKQSIKKKGIGNIDIYATVTFLIVSKKTIKKRWLKVFEQNSPAEIFVIKSDLVDEWAVYHDDVKLTFSHNFDLEDFQRLMSDYQLREINGPPFPTI